MNYFALNVYLRRGWNLKMKHKEWTMLLGRYQCLPPHKGHCELVRELLKQGKNVCIALRKEDKTEKNPFTQLERKMEFEKIFKKEIKEERICIIYVPDIIEIAYGRKPGWKITEIKLDKQTESISATEIRRKNETKKK